MFQVLIDDDKDFNNIDFDSGMQSSFRNAWNFPANTDYQEIPDGTWYWKARTKDSDGDWGLFSEPYMFTIDTNPPESSILFPENNAYYSTLARLSGNASDSNFGSGIKTMEIQIIRLDDSYNWNGITWVPQESWIIANGRTSWEMDSSSIDWSSGIKFNIRSRAIDNASNIELPKSGCFFTFDNDRPISYVVNPEDNGYINILSTISGIAMDFHGAGINSVEINIKRSNDNKYWSGTNWVPGEIWLAAEGTEKWSFDSGSISWTSGTKYTLRSRATDNVTNMEIPGIGKTFHFDSSKPSSGIDKPIDGSFHHTFDIISGNSKDIGGAGIKKVEISIKRDNDNMFWDGHIWSPSRVWLKVSGTNSWDFGTYDIKWTMDNEYTIHSRAIDKAGNVEISMVGNTFMFDNEPPDISISINNNEEYTNNSTLVLSLYSFDSGSGVYQMSFSENGNNWSIWEQWKPEIIMQLPKTNDGMKTIFFRVSDIAGNIAKPIYDSIILDTTPPEHLTISVNSNNEYVNSIELFLALSAYDALSGVSYMSFSFDGIAWTPWEPFEEQKSITIPEMHEFDGEKMIYFRARDRVNNTAKHYNIFTLDTTPPHSLEIIINNGESETKSRLVRLNLRALDDLSGVHQISLSSDGTNWSSWDEYIDNLSYFLSSNNGKSSIYFKAKDNAGNIAEPVSSEIFLNLTLPTTKSPDEKHAPNYWIYLIIITILIIICIILYGFFYKRRKNKQI
jgi:hypothetical protein